MHSPLVCSSQYVWHWWTQSQRTNNQGCFEKEKVNLIVQRLNRSKCLTSECAWEQQLLQNHSCLQVLERHTAFHIEDSKAYFHLTQGTQSTILVWTATVTKKSCLGSGHMEWGTSMRLMMSTASLKRWQVHCDVSIWECCGNFFWFFQYFALTSMNFSYLVQAEFSTPPLQKSSPSLRRWWHAPVRELSWPLQVSFTWPGRVGWMCVTPAGWETGASATPSTFVGHSVEGVFWGCGLFTYTQTRQDTHFLNPAMMPFVTQVGHHLSKEWRYWDHCHWYKWSNQSATDWT